MLTHLIEILGLITGLLYLWWEYHADARVWLASLVMPLISMWIYFSSGLYADFAINIYYLVIAVYGYIVWTRGQRRTSRGNAAPDSPDSCETTPTAITHTPLRVYPCAAAVMLALWWLLWWILVRFTDSRVPVADAFTTAMSVVGLWMMARKYAQQWWVWFVVDSVSTALYFYKGLPFYGSLYAVYCVVCIFGYRKWLRLMKSP